MLAHSTLTIVSRRREGPLRTSKIARASVISQDVIDMNSIIILERSIRGRIICDVVRYAATSTARTGRVLMGYVVQKSPEQAGAKRLAQTNISIAATLRRISNLA